METKARYALIGLFALGVILGAFGFVYWLHNTGGIGQKSIYQVRFDGPVSGLLNGSNVLFNGIRVGEVVALQLNPAEPQRVLATIAVDTSTPVRSDTSVSIDFQGLTGAPVIALSGGSPSAAAPASAHGTPPLLVAGVGAGQTLSQSARDTLGRIDNILSDNATPLHDAIGNISTFSQVLARNSDRIDKILAGLERMTGGTAGKPRLPVYDLTAAAEGLECPQMSDLHLVMPEPGSLMSLNADKIPVAGTVPDRAAFDNGQFADAIPALVQANVIETLENSRCFRSVTRVLEGVEPDIQLILDIRSFSVRMEPKPIADIDFSAKLVGRNGKIVGSQIFHETADLKSADAAGAAAALDESFGKILKMLVPWTARVSEDSAKQSEP